MTVKGNLIAVGHASYKHIHSKPRELILIKTDDSQTMGVSLVE